MDEENINNQQPAMEKVKKEIKEREEKKEPAVLFKTKGEFILFDIDNNELQKGKTEIILDEEKLSLMPEIVAPISVSLREISDFFAKDYNINLSFFDGKIIISQLGYQYEDFVEALKKIRDEIIQKDLLMKEGIRMSNVSANYEYQKDDQIKLGKCKVDIYDTGIVVKPEYGDLFRICFSEVKDFSFEEYKIYLNADQENLILSSLGEKFNIFCQTLKKTLDELSLKTQSILREILPETTPLIIQKLSQVFKDGLAVSKTTIEQISSELWSKLEKELVKIGLKESYDYLKSLSKTDQVFIGIKRDLMGDLTGEYIWFLMPISSEKDKNYLAMEASSTIKGGGKATYFFKISKEDNLDDLVKKFNRCMLAINFRRKPIYLSNEDLEKSDNLKYKIAISKIPELKLLRELFVGRVIHTSPENWKENVNKLINEDT